MQDRSQDHFTTITKLNNPISQIGSSSFSEFMTEEDLEDHSAQDSTRTSLVSSRTHALSKEDLVDEGAKAEGGSGREG
jgi:hypothetical protein